ncbi:hypothetical protein [Burkholderia sp. IDO3]|uniref:hypothetical protein n=1 Tax=Burkholderia sp. IDO3 TaxID=1705310 RepID=UPI000BBABED7|nr:hypothetical protein [Burkholderia sp. IDO3]AXK63260.1 hypothetical protein DCN14_11830 [Burkholderia sp. IDO3]PCD62300.1 hypothetical protein CN645_08645 [Burkholderia sp. IDO3]
MSCPECLKFPVPTSNYAEVAVNETMQSELHRCRTCGQLIKTIALDHGVYYLSPEDAREQFSGFDPSKY